MIYAIFLCLLMITASCKMFQKKYNNISGNALHSGNIYIAATTPIAILFFAAMSGWDVRVNLVTLIYAAFLAFLAYVSGILSIKALGKTDIATISVFSSAGAIVIPFLYGVIFLSEDVSIFKILSLIILLVVVVMPFIKGKNRKKTSMQGYIYCLLLFVEAGAATILYKLYAMADNVMSTNVFGFWGNVLMLPMLFVLIPKREWGSMACEAKSLSVWAYVCAILSVIAANVATILEIYVLNVIDLSFYTLFKNPLTLIITVLFSRVLFKEKITAEMAINIGLSIVALVLSGI